MSRSLRRVTPLRTLIFAPDLIHFRRGISTISGFTKYYYDPGELGRTEPTVSVDVPDVADVDTESDEPVVLSPTRFRAEFRWLQSIWRSDRLGQLHLEDGETDADGEWSGHRYALIFPWFAVHERRLQAYLQANGWPVLASLISCFNPYARLPGGRPPQAIEDTFAATWPDTPLALDTTADVEARAIAQIEQEWAKESSLNGDITLAPGATVRISRIVTHVDDHAKFICHTMTVRTTKRHPLVGQTTWRVYVDVERQQVIIVIVGVGRHSIRLVDVFNPDIAAVYFGAMVDLHMYLASSPGEDVPHAPLDPAEFRRVVRDCARQNPRFARAVTFVQVLNLGGVLAALLRQVVEGTLTFGGPPPDSGKGSGS